MIKFPLNRLAAAMAGVGLCTLAACGGGGSSSSADAQTSAVTPTAPTAPATPGTVTMSGVVATGAALSGATVKVYDSTGALVCDTVAGTAGDYSCDLGVAPKAPFVVKAALDDTQLISMFAEAVSSTVNVTPITNLIAARLSSNGDPSQLIADIQSAPAGLDKAKLTAAVDQVLAMLKPVTDALGVTANPLTGAFAADGTGQDKLLDVLSISVRPTGASSNIEITVKTVPTGDSADPLKLSFTSSDTSVAPISATLSAADLGTNNVAVLIADALKRMTDCYALPVAQRVSDGANAGSTVTAEACRSLFVGNDPASFLSNGSRVGPSGAFSGMFRAGGDGVSFDRGIFDFYRANGDLVFSYRWTNAAGGTDNDQIVARVEGGKLKMIGNQYAYEARVRAWVQNRELVNTPTFSHIDTGYNVYIGNRVDGSGNPIFSKVEVTTPRGNLLTYRPASGLSYLTVVNGAGSPTASSVIRLNGRYADPTNTAHPRVAETSLFYADPAVYTEDAIRAIPDQGVWKLEFFHADTNRPNVIQQYRTTSRAPTLAEAAAMSFAELAPKAKTDLISATSLTGLVSFSSAAGADSPNLLELTDDSGGDFWRVPSGALAPVSVTAYGRAPQVSAPGTPLVLGARFNDGISVSTLARKAVVPCSRQSVGDLHCDATLTSQFAQGTSVNSIELWARSARQVEVSKMIGIYKLSAPVN